MEELLQAVTIQHDPLASQQQRHAAYVLCEQVKEDPNNCLQVALALLADNTSFADPLVHFGLHCAERVVCFNWNHLSPEDHSSLKGILMSWVQNSLRFEHKSPYLLQKIAEITVQVALRDWPQDWKDFTSILLSSIIPTKNNAPLISEPQNISTIKLILLILRGLSHSVLTTDVNFPEKRKRAVQEGLTLVLEQTFVDFIHQILTEALVEPNINADLIKLCLQTCTAFASWIDPVHVLKSGMIDTARSCFFQQTFCADMCMLIAALCSKKLSGIPETYYQFLISLLDTTLEVMTELLKQDLNDDVTYMLSLLVDIVDKFVGTQTFLFVEEVTLITQVKLSEKLYQCLGTCLFVARHYELVHKVIDIWSKMFKHSAKLFPDFKTTAAIPLVNQLFPALTVYVQKSLPDMMLQVDDLTNVEMQQKASQLRLVVFGLLNQMTLCVPYAPLTCMHARLQEFVQKPLVFEKEQRNQLGYLLVTSPSYLELEGLTSLMECMFKSIQYKPSKQQPSIFDQDKERLIACVSQLYGCLLSYRPTDPLLLHARIRSFASFSFVLQYSPAILKSLIEDWFQYVQYKSPQEEAVPPLALSVDVRAARRRAAFTILALARANPQVFVSFLQECYSVVTDLSAKKLLTEDELLPLQQFLVAVASVLPSHERIMACADVMKSGLGRWSSKDFIHLLNSDQSPSRIAFMLALCDSTAAEMKDKYHSVFPCGRFADNGDLVDNYLFPDNPTSSSSNNINSGGGIHDVRQQVLHDLSIFDCIFKSTLLKNTKEHPIDHKQMAQMLFPVLESALAMLRTLHTLYHPQVKEKIPEQRRAAFADTRMHLRFLDTRDVSRAVNSVNSLLFGWITDVHQRLLSLVQAAISLGDIFYSTVPHLYPLAFGDEIMHIPSPLLRRLLMFVLVPYVNTCSPNRYIDNVAPLLKKTIMVIHERVTRGWSQFTQQQSSAEQHHHLPAQLEIAVMAELRELTRTFVDVIRLLFAESIPQPNDVKNKGGQIGLQSPTQTSAFCHFLAMPEHGELLSMMINFLKNCLLWDDNSARGKSIVVLLTLAPIFCSYEHLAQLFGTVVIQAALQTMATTVELGPVLLNYVALVQEVYCLISPHSNLVRQCLCDTLPNVDVQQIQLLDDKISTINSKKKLKAIMKEFLMVHCVGKLATNVSAKAIMNKPVEFKLPKKQPKQPEKDTSFDGIEQMFNDNA